MVAAQPYGVPAVYIVESDKNRVDRKQRIKFSKGNQMNLKSGQVACMLGEGMFDNEYAVEIDLVDGQKVSLFADRALVVPRESSNNGYLKVSVVKEDGQVWTILLPSEAFETGSRWVQVKKERVEFNTHDPKQRRDIEVNRQRTF